MGRIGSLCMYQERVQTSLNISGSSPEHNIDFSGFQVLKRFQFFSGFS